MTKMEVECEVWSRPCGFFRPVSSFNKGKKEEFSERVPYKLPKLEEIKL
jgi:ribonucleoside-triphosphate reductase